MKVSEVGFWVGKLFCMQCRVHGFRAKDGLGDFDKRWLRDSRIKRPHNAE